MFTSLNKYICSNYIHCNLTLKDNIWQCGTYTESLWKIISKTSEYKIYYKRYYEPVKIV